MTGPELDALIDWVESNISQGQNVHFNDAEQIVSELKIYRAMALRLERCVHDLVKEAEG